VLATGSVLSPTKYDFVWFQISFSLLKIDQLRVDLDFVEINQPLSKSTYSSISFRDTHLDKPSLRSKRFRKVFRTFEAFFVF